MKTNRFTLTSIGLLGLGFLLVALPQSNEKYEKLTQELLPKTVTIFVTLSRTNPETNQKQFAKFLGSGVFVTNKGHILSCAHLFNHKEKIEYISVAKSDGYFYPAILIYKDVSKDLSLIKIEEINTSYVKLEDPRKVREGQEVIAIGAPLGLPGSVTTGVISALHRDEINYDMIQMSAPINPGNSGGPLFNMKGRLVGINVNLFSVDPLFPSWSGIGFSVSASEINKFLSIFPDKTTLRSNSWR